MLLSLNPAAINDTDPGPVPGWLRPLVDAAQSGSSLITAVDSIVASLGFTTFTYGLTTASQLTGDERFYCLTTAPSAWVTEYDQQSYIEIDPRVQHGWTEVTPLIWDRRIGRDNPRVARFLDRAARYGIGSGVNVFLRDTRRARVMIGLSAPEREFSAERTAQVSERLGDYMLFGTIFHATYVRAIIEKGLAAAQLGSALSTREVQCLNLAAHGQTSRDIAFKLGITERTANFHFSNVLSKLGAMNRSEAIAKAATLGLLKED